jgi:hypothetical protein
MVNLEFTIYIPGLREHLSDDSEHVAVYVHHPSSTGSGTNCEIQYIRITV